MSVLLGRGDGTFDEPTVYPSPEALITCNTGDIDGDGTPDVVCPGGAAPAVVTYRGNGDGTFSDPQRIAIG